MWLLTVHNVPEDEPTGTKHVEDIKKYEYRKRAFCWFISVRGDQRARFGRYATGYIDPPGRSCGASVTIRRAPVVVSSYPVMRIGIHIKKG